MEQMWREKKTSINFTYHVPGTIRVLHSSDPQPFLAPGTGFVEDNFSMEPAGGGWGWVGEGRVGFGKTRGHHIYGALYVYYYYIVIYNKIIIQLTIM